MLAGLQISTRSKKNEHVVSYAVRLLATCPIVCYSLPLHNNQSVLMGTSHLPEKGSRSSGRRSKGSSVSVHQSEKTVASQQSPEKHDSNQKRENNSKWFPRDLKEMLDAIQRLACIGLGIWAFVHTNNYIEFITIIAVGQIDTRSAKEVIVRIIKAINVE